MRRQNAVLLSALLSIVGSACTGDRTAPGMRTGSTPGPGEEIVSIAIALIDDQCGVASATATVTGSDFASFTTDLDATGDAVVGEITGVPAGEDRLVHVEAFNEGGLSVYSGSLQVDVTAGEVTNASLTLYRNFDNCPAAGQDGGPVPSGDGGAVDAGGDGDTGSIAIDAGLDNTAGGAGAVSASFAYSDSYLSSDGVLHFYDPSSEQFHRLDVEARTWLPSLQAPEGPTAFAVTPEGDQIYVAYGTGRIDVIDTAAETSAFFGAAPAVVSTMHVVEQYLFTIDASGAWDTQALYDRATGARLYSDDWRDTSRSMVWSANNETLYFLNSGVSPTDLNMVPVDLAMGTFGAEVDSPYHGDYSLPNPLRLLPDESAVVAGSGNFFSTTDLSYQTSFGLQFHDLAFHGGDYYLLDRVGDTAQIRRVDASFNIVDAAYYDGQAERLFVRGDEAVLVTSGGGTEVTVRFVELPL